MAERVLVKLGGYSVSTDILSSPLTGCRGDVSRAGRARRLNNSSSDVRRGGNLSVRQIVSGKMAAKQTQRGPPCSSVSGRGERSQNRVSNTYCAFPTPCRSMHRFWPAPFARSLNNGSRLGKLWGPCCSPVPPLNPAARCTSQLKVSSLFVGSSP